MTLLLETPQSPGSYEDFLSAQELVDGLDAEQLYGQRLDNYRRLLAAERGLSVEELHYGTMGHVAIEADANTAFPVAS